MRARIATLLLAFWLAGCSVFSMPQGDVYFQDDFSNLFSGWDRVSGSDGVTDYSEGYYRIFSATTDYYLWATTGRKFSNDVRIEVDASKKSGADADVFGVLCRYQNEKNFYVLMISGDGQAGIAKRSSAGDLVLLSGDSLQSLPDIRRGPATNHLRADCTGTSLALYVNDVLAASAEDSEFTGGDAGLWLGAYDRPGSEILFDNFVVRKPS
jgi:hypothetical protein